MADDVEYQSLIYKRGDSVEIYKGIYKPNNSPICIKVLFCDSIEAANEILQESFNMMRFKDIPNIVKIYKADLSQSNNRYFVRVIMEYYEEGDLKKLIRSRLPNNYWSEGELLNHLLLLVETFALLETRKVAHRDIKPENIFVSDFGKRLIVGDLGSAKEKIKNISETIAGTPLYLSPEVRKAYSDHLMGNTLYNFSHDPFKSDVYSLGLTFLYMASLRECTDLLQMGDLEIKTQNRINELERYPSLKNILSKMLAFNKDQRISFSELFEEIKPKTVVVEQQICFKCERRMKSSKYVFDKYICNNCYEISSQLLWAYQYPCVKCNKMINNEGCVNCQFYRCSYCKCFKHNNSCIQEKSEKNSPNELPCLFCLSNNTISYGNLKGYYFTCLTDPSNHKYCVVCSRSIGYSHAVCSLIIQMKIT
ncbi:hypothetical protein SteCoe_1565 [Stentor coeruleus]|uniref:Protein kinase domain-containing protein n=1 Tax=Stentor coeruleus TaxID=5963 RepID=A0A1R2D1U8_9CILI|nr:hypothetical protein SteCoe_1565 [Stentor coeruleus]